MMTLIGIRKSADEREPEIPSSQGFQAIPGHGAQAKVSGRGLAEMREPSPSTHYIRGGGLALSGLVCEKERAVNKLRKNASRPLTTPSLPHSIRIF
jgi:hypothetical protein